MPRSLLKTVVIIAASLVLGHAAAADHPSFKVDVTGQGAPVILIPGLGSPGEVWASTVAHYCGKRQCHVLSLAGFAGQPAIGTPLIATVEQQLSDYIREHKLEHPVVIGHSLGGFIGMKLASDHPAQVGRLVIIDTLPALMAARIPGTTPEQLKLIAEDMRTRMLGQDAQAASASTLESLRSMISKQEDIDRAMAWAKQSDRMTVINTLAEMTADDLRPGLNHITAPTLVLGSWIAYKNYGNKDSFTQLYKSQYQQLPNVKVELADNARHFIMYDDPAWMYDRIDNFLN